MSSRQKRLAASGLILLVGLLVMAIMVSRRGRGDIEPTPMTERTRAQLELRDGLLHPRDSPSDLFTGLLVESYPDGRRKVEIEIAAGRPHGRSRGWFNSGQLEVEEFFVEGVSHGTRTRWHENGTRRSEANIVKGQLEGMFVEWHDNGVQSSRISLQNGKPDGKCWSWHPSGALKSIAWMQQGDLVKREFFPDQSEPAPATAGLETAAVEVTE